MADNAPNRNALPVGESYERDLSFSLTINRQSPAVYHCKVDGYATDLRGTGPTEEMAVARAITNAGAFDQEIEARRLSEQPQEGTRRIVGNDVSSEQLRDTYLGGS